MATELTAQLSADSSGTSQSVEQLRSKLEALNAMLTETKQKIKDTSDEFKRLTKQKEELSAAMKDGATEKQKEEMKALQDSTAQLTSDFTKFLATEKELQNEVDSTNKQLDQQKEHTENLKKALSDIGNSIKNFVTSNGTKKLWEMLIGSNAEMEQYQTSLEIMLGDVDRAKTVMEGMREFALSTPFALDDVFSNGKMLMNYGVEPDELIDTMTKLGDLSGGNAEQLNRVTQAYSKMLENGKVSSDELRQLTEAGIPLQNALSEAIGVTGEKLSEMVSDGKVGIDDLNNAIVNLTTGDGLFAGAMEKQSQTMNGMLSSIQEELNEFMRQLGEGAFGEVNNVLSYLIAHLQELEADGTLEKWASGLGNTIKTVVNIITGAIETVLQFSNAIAAGAVAVGTFKVAMSISNIISSVIEAIRSLTVVTQGVTTATEAATVAQTAFNTATKASPIGLLVSVGVAAVAGIMTLASSFGDAAVSVEHLGQTAKTTISELKTLDDIKERYKQINDTVTDQRKKKEELKALQEELNELYKTEAENIDLVNGGYEEQLGLLENLDGSKRTRAINDTQDALDIAKKEYRHKEEASISVFFDYNELDGDKDFFIKKVKEAKEKYGKEIVDFLDTGNGMYVYIGGKLRERQQALEELGQVVEDTGKATGLLAKEWRALDNELTDVGKKITTVDELSNTLNSLEVKQNDAGDAINDIGDSAEDTCDSLNDYNKETANAEKMTEKLATAAEQNRNNIKNLANEYSRLASVVEEYHENGELSLSTALGMIDSGYSAAFAIDAETGAIRLNIEAYKDLVKAKLEAQKASIVLEKQTLSERNAQLMNELETLSRVNAEEFSARQPIILAEYKANAERIKEIDESSVKALEAIYNAMLGDVEKWDNDDYSYKGKGSSGSVSGDNYYKSAYEAYKTEADKKLELIKRELEAKRELRDETIAAIDAEIEARKRLNEDNDLEDEINEVKAQLKYSRLDDFSREQLEKRLSDLYDEKSELNWQRQMADRKAAANEEYALYEEQAKAAQDRINGSIDTYKAIIEAIGSGASAMTVINNNNSTRNNTANINLAQQGLTMAQITKAVKNALMDDIII